MYRFLGVITFVLLLCNQEFNFPSANLAQTYIIPLYVTVEKNTETIVELPLVGNSLSVPMYSL